MTVSFHRAARAELIAALGWYSDRSPLAALGFANAVDAAIAAIAKSPNRFPQGGNNLRQFNLRRFPFTIHYLNLEKRVVIIAVAHQKRPPNYWVDRLETD